MNYGYIYKTTCLLDNKIYIGQHVGEFNPDYFGSGIYLKRVLIKYGTDNFKIELLKFAYTKEELNSLEIEYIARYRSLFPREEMYNISDGGDVPPPQKGIPRTEVTKNKIRNTLIGHELSRLTKDKIRKSLVGIKHTEVRKENMRRNRPSYKGSNNPFFGRKHTDATKIKMRIVR